MFLVDCKMLSLFLSFGFHDPQKHSRAVLRCKSPELESSGAPGVADRRKAGWASGVKMRITGGNNSSGAGCWNNMCPNIVKLLFPPEFGDTARAHKHMSDRCFRPYYVEIEPVR